jgi:tetratricopeptide (TPR) repeat protein
VQAVDTGINVLIVPIDAVSGAPRLTLQEYSRIRPYSVFTRALAQKKPQDDDFRPEPDVRATFPRKPRNGAAPTVAPDIPVAPPVTPLPVEPPAVVPGGGVRLSDVPDVIGPAAASAPALRRALVRSGYFDVLSAAPDSAAIRRAINERRLSQRALDRVQDALQILATSTVAPANADANPDAAVQNQIRVQSAQAQGVTAASQIGQALGYRSVVLLAVWPNAATDAGKVSSTYAMLMVDAYRETGEFLAYDESGADALGASEAAASTGAALLDKKMDMWPPVSAADLAVRAADYLQRARTYVAQQDIAAATEALNQSLALDPSQRDAQVLLGDILQSTDPLGAAAAYRRALDSGAAQPGQTWEKIASAYAAAKDWPRTLDAGRRALALQWDTATLRMAMATAQFGRSDLFRKADRPDSADEAEADARRHLDRARELSPDDPKITRLLAMQLVSQGRVREAAESLDKLMAVTEQPDLDLLTLYATVLTDRGGRDVEAFQAWARVWRQSGVSVAPMNAIRYRHIAEGFDQYVSDTAKQAMQLTTGVANGTLPRESALLQLQKLADDAKAAEAAIKVLQPPAGNLNEANQASRLFAATTITQAVNAHRVYVETGDDIYRSRATELHRQAIMQLNIARGAKSGT